MKQFLRISMMIFLLASSSGLWAQYGIGTNRPNESAALEIVSPDKGVLIPSLSLTSTSVFAPITGTSSNTHTGMIVWNESTSTANGLTGAGFYYWENDPAVAGSGNWHRLTSTDDEVIPTGTVTNSLLRWNGTEWVESETLLLSATGTATLAANTTVTGTLNVQGTSTLATTTIQNDLTVQGSTTLATTTLGAALIDASGDAGTAGQVLSTTGTSTEWIDSFAPAMGTTTNTTLRWDGNAWVESETLMQSDTGTATLAANTTVTGTLNVQGTSTLATATIQNDLTVQGSTTLATTTLGAALIDASGDAGTAGQVLSTTGTSTEWIDSFAPAMGTTTNTTLRWDGNAWVESETLMQSDTGTATLAANTTVTGTLEVTGNTTVTGDTFVEGTTTASGTLTAQNTATLEGALVDSFGNTGTTGQVLSSTGTSTRWIDANAATLATMSASGNVTSTVSLLMLTPAADMTVTLQDASLVPVGFEIKIRRNQGYTGTDDDITLQGASGQNINGVATRNLNVGFQSLTLVSIGSEWVSVN